MAENFRYPLQQQAATASYSGGQRKAQYERELLAERQRQFNEQLAQAKEVQRQNQQAVEQAQKDQLLRTQRAQETLDLAKEQLKLAQDKFKQTSDVELQAILSGARKVPAGDPDAEFDYPKGSGNWYTSQPRLRAGEEYTSTEPEVTQPTVEQPTVQPTPELSEADRWETGVQSWKQQQEKKEFKEKYGDTEIIEPPSKPAPVTPTRPTIPEEIKGTARYGKWRRLTAEIKILERQQKVLKIPTEPKKSNYTRKVGKRTIIDRTAYDRAVKKYNNGIKRNQSLTDKLSKKRDEKEDLLITAREKWEAKQEKLEPKRSKEYTSALNITAKALEDFKGNTEKRAYVLQKLRLAFPDRSAEINRIFGESNVF